MNKFERLQCENRFPSKIEFLGIFKCFRLQIFSQILSLQNLPPETIKLNISNQHKANVNNLKWLRLNHNSKLYDSWKTQIDVRKTQKIKVSYGDENVFYGNLWLNLPRFSSCGNNGALTKMFLCIFVFPLIFHVLDLTFKMFFVNGF